MMGQKGRMHSRVDVVSETENYTGALNLHSI